jgi:ATP-dependent DNA ligase
MSQRSTASPLAAPPLQQLSPMLLGQRKTPPTEQHWTHELKFDGYRVLADAAPNSDCKTWSQGI